MTNPYTSLPYTAVAIEDTDPDSLAVAAHLRGLAAPDIGSARVLEFGCADGTNLMAMAAAGQGAEFVGIDLDPAAISRGREIARRASLPQVRLEHADVANLATLGLPDASFDFIVCHGVYSWVPPATADALMALTGRLLAADGVAYLSYKTFPGAHVQEMVAEQLRLLVAHLPRHERVGAARAWLRIMAESTADTEHARVLRHYAAEALEKPDFLLAHDELSDDSHPYNVRDVIAQARRAGLDFLAEAGPPFDRLAGFPDDVRSRIDRLPEGERQQAIDAVTNGRFRRSLWVHSGRQASRNPEPQSLEGVLVGAGLVVDEAHEKGRHLKTREGVSIRTGDSRLIHDLRALGAAWPACLPVESLTAPRTKILRLHAAGAVELRLTPPIAVVAGEFPQLTNLALSQVASETPASSLRHRNATIVDATERTAANLCDGRHSRQEIAATVAAEHGSAFGADWLDTLLDRWSAGSFFLS